MIIMLYLIMTMDFHQGFPEDKDMSLPVYQTINLKTAALEDLNNLLNPDLNLRHPVVINLQKLTLDDQREIIGLIENYFVTHNLSFKFPYAVFLISDHEKSITRVPLVNSSDELPKFYASRDSKMNVKEAHLAGKNKLLQLEVKNSDAGSNEKVIQSYGEAHRVIFELETERRFYRTLLNKMMKGQNG